MLNLDGYVRIHGLIRFGELLHDGGDRGGSRDHDFATCASSGKGSRILVNAYVAVILDDRLTIGAHDEVHEVLCRCAEVLGEHDVEWPGHLVVAALHVLRRCLDAVDLDGLDRIVERAKRNVSDTVGVARYRRHHHGSRVSDGGCIRRHVNLVAARILLFQAEQFDERTARARTIFT